jgi:hypothetical protein
MAKAGKQQLQLVALMIPEEPGKRKKRQVQYRILGGKNQGMVIQLWV